MDAESSMRLDDGIDMELDTLKIKGDPTKLYGELAKASVDFVPIPKKKDGQAGGTKFKYAGYATVMRCVRPALSAHGISVIQPLHWLNGMAVSTIIVAGHGASISSSFSFKSEYAKKQKDGTVSPDPQEFGRCHTYYRRYQLQAMLGLEGDADADDLPDVNEEKSQFSEPARDATTGEAVPAKPASSPKASPVASAPTTVPEKAAPVATKPESDSSKLSNGSAKASTGETNKSLNELLTMAMKELKWQMEDLRTFFKEHVDEKGIDKVNNLTVEQKSKLMDQLVKLKGVTPF